MIGLGKGESFMSNGAQNDTPVVQTATGRVRGCWKEGVAMFLGIPYATPPVGSLRFAAPRPHPGWSGVLDAVDAGPAAPQPASVLEPVLGTLRINQSEDCLSLNIWTPGQDGGPFPVLLWIHGGGYGTGAGSLPWYSGEEFARNGRLVVVTINYRLGALGYLYLSGPGRDSGGNGNFGLRDQIAALQWVRDNIASFGGDPDRITVAGQSTGAHAVAALMASPAARGLFRRAILQSPPLGFLPVYPPKANRIAGIFLGALGLGPGTAAELRYASVEKIIAAQQSAARRERTFADITPAFGPVVDGDVLPEPPMEALEAGAGSDVDLLIGTTHDEMTAFFAFDPAMQQARRARVVIAMRSTCGRSSSEDIYGAYAAARADATPADILTDFATDLIFRIPGIQLAEHRAAQGRPAYMYRFDWQSPVCSLRACHCLELPFCFHNFAEWQNAPMLQGADPAGLELVSQQVHRAWMSFIQSGDPNHADLPSWTPYETPRRATMCFGKESRLVDDAAGSTWEIRRAA